VLIIGGKKEHNGKHGTITRVMKKMVELCIVGEVASVCKSMKSVEVAKNPVSLNFSQIDNSSNTRLSESAATNESGETNQPTTVSSENPLTSVPLETADTQETIVYITGGSYANKSG